MRFPLYIALRYLFSRKSHNVINVISWISVAGMAIGSAALILILSVYNGFDSLIKSNLSDVDPDIRVVPAQGKYFEPSDELIEVLEQTGASLSYVLEDNIFFSYGERQGIARARGVEDGYLAESGLSGHIIDGHEDLTYADVNYASVGSVLAYTNAILPRFVDPMILYFPDREAKISVSNPASSLRSARVRPGSIFSISSDVDAELLIVPYRVMKELLGCDLEVSSIELRGQGLDARKIQKSVGPGFDVLDRYHQHPSLFKMMRYEKAAIFLILFFVVIIVAFNIFGSMSMLLVEKSGDIRTLAAMGAHPRDIRSIFVLEGWMVSLLGLSIGLVAGVAAALAQQTLGLVKLPGSFMVQAYPVELQLPDVLLTAAGVALIGYAVSFLSARQVNTNI